MTGRRVYQLALLGSIALAVVSAVLAVIGWLGPAVAALALAVAALAAMVHLRTLVLLKRMATPAPAPTGTPAVAPAQSPAGTETIEHGLAELKRAQAASESFILADLLALRQRVNALIEVSDARDEER